jgi:protein-tyrosine-phosphatase
MTTVLFACVHNAGRSQMAIRDRVSVLVQEEGWGAVPK